MFDAKRAINGTFGQMWLDNALVRETTKLKAEVSLDFMNVNMCGDLKEHQKVSGIKCKGSIGMAKVNSRMAILLSEKIKKGQTPYFTIISKLADPDAFGAERVVLKNCVFSNLTLVDWSAKQVGEITQNFTFTDWEFIDQINPE